MKQCQLVTSTIIWLIVHCSICYSSGNYYISLKDGFSIDLGDVTVKKIEEPQIEGYINLYESNADGKGVFSVYAYHLRDKTHSKASIEAFQDALVESKSGFNVTLNVLLRKGMTYKGFPALSYKTQHVLENKRVITRGIIFSLDGDHFVLSYLSLDEVFEESDFSRILKTFELTSIQPTVNGKAHYLSDIHKYCYPPSDWIAKHDPYPGSPVKVIYANPGGHSILIMSARNSDPYETYKAGILKAEEVIYEENGMYNQIRFKILKTKGYNQYAKKTMVTSHYYCKIGEFSTIVGCAAPEETFFRSEFIFNQFISTFGKMK